MPWIDHPATTNPVGPVRWLKFHASQWMERKARQWEIEALYPDCEECGKPRTRGDHSACNELPF